MRHNGTVELETERIILRPLRLEDAESVYGNWASDDEVTKYLTWPTHTSVAASAGYIAYCIHNYADQSTYQWGIELKDTHELIGNISAVHIDGNTDSVELGWVIGRAWWHHGYTAEAAARLLRFFFEEVDANRVAAKHDVNNPNSGRVMRKIGMQYEGTLRQSDRNNQGIVDTAWYSILKSDFMKTCTTGE